MAQMWGHPCPKTTEALGNALPRASATYNPDCVNQTAPTSPTAGGHNNVSL
jgi:hypothetical protein